MNAYVLSATAYSATLCHCSTHLSQVCFEQNQPSKFQLDVLSKFANGVDLGGGGGGGGGGTDVSSSSGIRPPADPKGLPLVLS